MLVLCFTLSKDHVIPIPTAVPMLIAATRRKIGRFLASGSPHKYIRASKEGCSQIRVGSSHGSLGKQGPLASRHKRVLEVVYKVTGPPREAAAPTAQTLLYIACMRSAVVRGPKALTNGIPAGHRGGPDHDSTKGPSCVTSSRTYRPSTGRFSAPTDKKQAFQKRSFSFLFLSRRGAARPSATWALRRQRVVELPNEGGKAT